MNELLNLDNQKNQIKSSMNQGTAVPGGGAHADDDAEFFQLQLDGAEQEEHEQQKILAKRRRRSQKIEDVPIDINYIFSSKKRFKPDESTCDSNEQSSGYNLQLHQAKQSM